MKRPFNVGVISWMSKSRTSLGNKGISRNMFNGSRLMSKSEREGPIVEIRRTCGKYDNARLIVDWV